MEIICLGFLIGIVFSVVVFGTSVLYFDRKYKEQFNKEADDEES